MNINVLYILFKRQTVPSFVQVNFVHNYHALMFTCIEYVSTHIYIYTYIYYT